MHAKPEEDVYPITNNCVGKEMLIACGVAIAIGTPLAAIGVPIIHHSALLTTASFYCHIALR